MLHAAPFGEEGKTLSLPPQANTEEAEQARDINRERFGN